MSIRQAAIMFAFSAACVVRADVYLVGAQLYRSMPDGTNHPASEFYQFSTNAGTGHAPLPMGSTEGTAIAIALGMGTHTIAFRPGSVCSSWDAENVGLNLFVLPVPASFNPPHTGVGIAGDLTIVARTDGSGAFSVPVAGTIVQSYETSDLLVSVASANGRSLWNDAGASVRVVGVAIVSEQAANGSHCIEGSFTLEVASPCRADTDGNGAIAVPDIFAFLSLWFAGDVVAANYNGDCCVNVADIFAFLAEWFAGC